VLVEAVFGAVGLTIRSEQPASAAYLKGESLNL
jgi:hypothetical protein